jgi:hypothetical protein
MKEVLYHGNVVSGMYQNCFNIKEMKKQTGGRMMKTAFKHFGKTENYEAW